MQDNITIDYITKQAEDAIQYGHLKQDTKNMITFGLIISVLVISHIFAYNSGIQTGVIMTAHTVNIADAVAEINASSLHAGHLKEHSEELMRGF